MRCCQRPQLAAYREPAWSIQCSWVIAQCCRTGQQHAACWQCCEHTTNIECSAVGQCLQCCSTKRALSTSIHTNAGFTNVLTGHLHKLPVHSAGTPSDKPPHSNTALTAVTHSAHQPTHTQLQHRVYAHAHSTGNRTGQPCRGQQRSPFPNQLSILLHEDGFARMQACMGQACKGTGSRCAGRAHCSCKANAKKRSGVSSNRNSCSKLM
jgi:hypothetical protein